MVKKNCFWIFLIKILTIFYYYLEGSEEEEENEEERTEREAYERMEKDIPISESDHLDTDLAAESEFLQQYLDLLNAW